MTIGRLGTRSRRMVSDADVSVTQILWTWKVSWVAVSLNGSMSPVVGRLRRNRMFSWSLIWALCYLTLPSSPDRRQSNTSETLLAFSCPYDLSALVAALVVSVYITV